MIAVLGAIGTVSASVLPEIIPRQAQQEIFAAVAPATPLSGALSAGPVAPNSLIIPRIGVDAPTIEGDDVEVLERGMWLRPGSAKPGTAGNVIVAGHRVKYRSGPYTLYRLDELQPGDEVSLVWEGTTHTYKVREQRVVLADEIAIEGQTLTEQLTVYTCHPTWSSKERLVVFADPV
jgi:sortase A